MNSYRNERKSGIRALMAGAIVVLAIGGLVAFAAPGSRASDGMSHGMASDQNGQEAAADQPAGLMLALPAMNPARGRKLFTSKGCAACHSINGVGGEDAPPLGVSTMPGRFMNPFDFAARMWRGAEAMIAMQNEELGHQIELDGQELADIIAFAHDPQEQKKFSESDLSSLTTHQETSSESD